MELTRNKKGYSVVGHVYQPGNEDVNSVQDFQEKIDTLPAYINTGLGTLTLTASDRYQMKTGDTYVITILPPMMVEMCGVVSGVHTSVSRPRIVNSFFLRSISSSVRR